MEETAMATSVKRLDIYLEIGKQRTIAGVLEWPGWCRVGRDEAAALAALLAAGPRYAKVVRRAKLVVPVPEAVEAFVVVERVQGNGTTDFGVPIMEPASDAEPIKDAEVERLQTILKACWRALDAAARQAKGKTLRLGPRGGGRSLAEIIGHVEGAERGYLTSLGGALPQTADAEPSPAAVRKTILETLLASAHGEVPAKGPRGGKRWSPRYAARRMAWHVLDHLWEIEDRTADAEN
jgi:hypothetical protein